MSVFTRSRAATSTELEHRESGDEISAAAYALRSGRSLSGGAWVSRTESQRVSTVYACARLHADLISTMPVSNYRKRNGIATPVDPPSWVRRPNPDQRWTEFVDAVVMSCMYDGEAFGLITPGPDGLPVALTLLDARSVIDTPDGGWTFNNQPIPPHLMWQVKTVPSPNPRRGMSPLTLARLSIGTALAGRRYVSDFFSDGAHPSIEIVSDLPELTGEQAAEIKAGAQNAMNGNREPWVHGSGLTSKTWQVSPADADFLNVMGVTDLDVCRFMGVRQTELVGVPMQGGSTVQYTNTEQRGTALQQFTIGPFIRRLEEAFSDDQLSQPGDMLELDSSGFLRGDQATEARIEDMRIRNGTLARDEVRARHNEPPVPDGTGGVYLWPPYRAFPLPSDSEG